MNFPNRLKSLREKRGWSQRKLAMEANVSQPFISGLELGNKNPTILIVKKLATALDVSISDLLDDQAPTGTEG